MSTDLSQFNNSFCHMSGSQNTFLLHKHQRDDNFTEYMFPSISIVPPHKTEGCFINLYYNTDVLEDTLYISKLKKTKSKNNNWKIKHIYEKYAKDHYARDHYTVFKLIPNTNPPHNSFSNTGKLF